MKENGCFLEDAIHNLDQIDAREQYRTLNEEYKNDEKIKMTTSSESDPEFKSKIMRKVLAEGKLIILMFKNLYPKIPRGTGEFYKAFLNYKYHPEDGSLLSQADPGDKKLWLNNTWPSFAEIRGFDWYIGLNHFLFVIFLCRQSRRGNHVFCQEFVGRW